jgi:hypothetical protein
MTTSEWLFPQPRSIPNDPAAYWPDTCFLELPPPPLDEDELSRLAPDGSDAPPVLEEYYALVQHEHTHWIQAQAFGYGRFQAQVDQARTEIAESLFLLVGSATANGLLARRAKGEPVFDAAGRRPVFRTDLGPVVQRLQRHWWSLGLLRYELDRAPANAEGALPLRYRFGLAALYARAGPDVSQVASLGDPELKAAAFDCAPETELDPHSTPTGATTLDAAALAECAAVLNQTPTTRSGIGGRRTRARPGAGGRYSSARGSRKS